MCVILIFCLSLETFALRHWDLHRAAPCCLTHPKLATTITMTKLDKPLPVIETPQHTWRLMRLMCMSTKKQRSRDSLYAARRRLTARAAAPRASASPPARDPAALTPPAAYRHVRSDSSPTPLRHGMRGHKAAKTAPLSADPTTCEHRVVGRGPRAAASLLETSSYEFRALALVGMPDLSGDAQTASRQAAKRKPRV